MYARAMLKLARRLLVLSLLILTALQVDVRGKSGAANADSPPNLAPNPSFELAQQAGKLETTAVAGWTFVPSSVGVDTGLWDQPPLHTGRHSLRLTSPVKRDRFFGEYCNISSSGYWESVP